MILYRKFYRCSECGHEWEDTWDCLCNDRCPACNAETEPYEYEEVQMSNETSEPYTLDFDDYVAARGGLYLPFPAAVELVHFWDWARSMWQVLRAGRRPPAERVAVLLEKGAYMQCYLPPHIACDYPTVPNPYAAKEVSV